MKTIDALKKRRSYRDLDDNINVSDEKIADTIKEILELVPDAFNMKSQRVVLVQVDKHKKLWDSVYEEFGGQVAKEKTDVFKNASGTVLFFYDSETVEKMKKEFSLYEKQFEPWAYQSNGMLQLSIWDTLCEMGLGANLQHYNPVIDKRVKEMFDVDDNYVLLAEMVYGNILSDVDKKEKEDINKRFKISK